TKLRIYLLPDLLTAGNLFCGFLALTKIVSADITPTSIDIYAIREAIFLIILACVFDLFDGRVARLGGEDSPFGREFDSLADIISFGAAPAFLVHRVVLRNVFEIRHRPLALRAAAHPGVSLVHDGERGEVPLFQVA